MPFCVYSPAEKSCISFNKENNSFSVNGNSLKILQMTDLHINGVLDMPYTYSVMKRLIYSTDPDLIVFSGDMFSNGCSLKNVNEFVKFVEKFELPWTCVMGNHDDETPLTLLELSTKLQNAKNSLFKTGNVPEMYGNYHYNVEFLDNQKFQFIFMDSRIYGFTKDSVDYYENVISNTKNQNNGKIVNNFLFYHIPLKEMNLAINEYTNNKSIGKGEILEPVCYQETEVNFFEKVLQLNATKAMIFGHDHINNAIIKYKNIDFCYGTKTGVSSYNKISMVGGVVYNLNSNGSYSSNIVYA